MIYNFVKIAVPIVNAFLCLALYAYLWKLRLLANATTAVATTANLQQQESAQDFVEMGMTTPGANEALQSERKELRWDDHAFMVLKVALAFWFAFPTRIYDNVSYDDIPKSLWPSLLIRGAMCAIVIIFVFWKDEVYRPTLTLYQSLRLRVILVCFILAVNSAAAAARWAQSDESEDSNPIQTRQYLNICIVMGSLAFIVFGCIGAFDRYKERKDRQEGNDLDPLNSSIGIQGERFANTLMNTAFQCVFLAVGLMFVATTFVAIFFCGVNGTCS